ncbi:hypothetical protein FA95DRAFT_1567514 [Auriscalpium vulgare]|uniref:Uncharacterized protein n=1 Tax=Auriscalpium vulgare TaxID=40419 RepID=A0ACB8R421_9AGAM|nr:hypothetical protein FA95DRAFT_1567514 [Auriscalpium vulgare]
MAINYAFRPSPPVSSARHRRGLKCINEERAANIGANSAIADVRYQLVNAMTRMSADPDNAVDGYGTTAKTAHNPKEGRSFLHSVEELLHEHPPPRRVTAYLLCAGA